MQDLDMETHITRFCCSGRMKYLAAITRIYACLRLPAPACACLRLPAPACACLRVPAHASANGAAVGKPRGRYYDGMMGLADDIERRWGDAYVSRRARCSWCQAV
jgi:hypothetical protein